MALVHEKPHFIFSSPLAHLKPNAVGLGWGRGLELLWKHRLELNTSAGGLSVDQANPLLLHL